MPILPFALGAQPVGNVASANTTAAQLRAADHQEFAHIALIEGIPYAFTDEDAGELWGSGVNSWIGNSELELAPDEQTGRRTILPGLKLPRGMSQARDPKTGNLMSRPIQITIQDNANGAEDNIVAGLLGENEKPFDVLGQTVDAGTSNLPNSLIAWGVGASLNPQDRYIGIEKIGPLGQRHEFPVFPRQRIGYQHAVFPNIPEPNGLPLVKVSDSAIVWEGRRVAIYRVFRNPNANVNNWTAWPLWEEQHDAGNLVWWGKLRGEAKVNGQQEWSLQLVGADSFQRGKLGVNTTEGGYPVSANTILRDEERFCSVLFAARGDTTGITYDTFEGTVFTSTLSASGNKESFRDEIDAIIQGQFDGTLAADVNAADNHFVDWGENPSVGLDDSFRFYIEKDVDDNGTNAQWGEMRVVLHDKMWRTLGFDPLSQNAPHPLKNGYNAEFNKLEVGSQYHDFLGGDAATVVPSADYFEGVFTTVSKDYTPSTDDWTQWDNGGLVNRFSPTIQNADTFYLDKDPGQTVYLPSVSPFVEPQTSLLPFPGAQVEGTDTDGARIVVFHGKRLPTDGIPDPDQLEAEAEDYFAVAQVSFVTTATVGEILPTAEGVPAVHIDQWLDARAFGFDVEPHDRRWNGANAGPARIQMTFLGGWPSNAVAGNQPEYANTVLTQILLSSGTGTGFGALSLDEGDNSSLATADFDLGGDWESADFGLGIPYSMVASPASIREAFDQVPGGADGPLNRVRYMFSGPVKAQEILDGIMRTRRLGWTLHGRQYGVQRLGIKTQDDVQLVIGEDDLHGDPNDPRSVIPKVEPGRLGAFDDVALGYRHRPLESGGIQQTLEVGARDEGARYRSGDIKIDVQDAGLLPYRWYTDMTVTVGAEPWHQDFRTLWQYETAQMFAQRHHIVTVKVGPHIALDCRPGTVVRFSNPWVVSSSGTYGLTNAVGTIEEAIQHPDSGAATLKILIFGGSFAAPAHFGPVLRVNGWTGAVLDVSTDTFAHGNAARPDVNGFVAPSWADNSTNMAVDLVERAGDVYTTTDLGEVVSVDADNATVTLDASVPSSVLRDTDKWLIPRAWDNQPVGGWVRDLYGWVCSDDLRHSSGDEPGDPFV